MVELSESKMSSSEHEEDKGIVSLKELVLNSPKPKLIVFDLDYTLWPFWCDTHVSPPFKKTKKSIFDRNNYDVKMYPKTRQLLEILKGEGFLIAAASRTETPDVAETLLSLFDINKYFDFKQIFPDRKLRHFNNLKEESGVNYNEMIFFDDEMRNITDISSLNVVCQYIQDGIDVISIETAFKEFQKRK